MTFHKPIRAKLNTAPRQPVLMQLVREAEKAPGFAVQVTWPADQSGQYGYTLTCIIPESAQQESEDPEWTLYKALECEAAEGNISEIAHLFTYVTIDLVLLQNMIAAETQPASSSTAASAACAPTVAGGSQSANTESAALSTQSTGSAAQGGWTSTASGPVPAPNTVPTSSRTVAQPSENASSQARAMRPRSGSAAQSVAERDALQKTLSTGQHQAFGEIDLTGEIGTADLSSIFQSIYFHGMTGKLTLYRKSVQAEVYFSKGILVDATAHDAVTGERSDLSADELVLDLLSWDAGTFRFHPDWSSAAVTITRPLDSLIDQAALLREYMAALKEKGFSEEAFLSREQELVENQISQLLSSTVPVDLNLQNQMYLQISVSTPILTVIGGVPRSKWLPILHNLTEAGLVTISSGNRMSSSSLQPVVIDESLAHYAELGLARPESGIVSYPNFLYFLKQELARHRKSKHPFSLVLLDIEGRDHSGLKSDMDTLAHCFNEVKDEYDLFGHFETLGITKFAMLLPYRKLPSAFFFVDNFLFKLKPRGIYARTNLWCGIAAMPDDASDLHTLVAAANQAKQSARDHDRSLCTYQGIEFQVWEELHQKGDAAIVREQLERASDIWLNALTEAEKFPEDDPRLLTSLDRLSGIYMIQAKFSLAEPLLKLSLDLRANGYLDTDTLLNQDQLAKCYYEQGKLKDAESSMLVSISMCEQLFGPEHEALGDAYHNLATLYHLQNLFDAARSCYQKALYFKRKSLGSDHPETLKIAQNYAKLMRRQGSQHDEDMINPFITGSYKAIKYSAKRQDGGGSAQTPKA